MGGVRRLPPLVGPGLPCIAELADAEFSSR
jgi:hypothetical protein